MAADSAYLGVWQDPGPGKTIEIRKDGDTYLYDDLRDYGMNGKKKGPIVLTANGEKLVFTTPFGSAPLGLSGDKNTLYFDKWVFKHVLERDAAALKVRIAGEKSMQLKGLADCDALEKEYDSKTSAVYKSNASGKEKTSSVQALKSELKARAQTIPECKRLTWN